MNTEEKLSEVVASMVANKKTDLKKLFTIKTVPTVEDYSNIGFDGLQELADIFRDRGRECYANDDEAATNNNMDRANKCEALFDKYNGMSTMKVDVNVILQDCGDMLSEVFDNFVFMAAQGINDDGMYFEFVLGPTLHEIKQEISETCPCESCAAERETANIPKDQLN